MKMSDDDDTVVLDTATFAELLVKLGADAKGARASMAGIGESLQEMIEKMKVLTRTPLERAGAIVEKVLEEE